MTKYYLDPDTRQSIESGVPKPWLAPDVATGIRARHALSYIAPDVASDTNAIVSDGGGGGGDLPEWVPENAKIHIDLVGGSPQGRAWVDGVGIVEIDTLLGTDENSSVGATSYDPENLTSDGYVAPPGEPVAGIGSLRTQVFADATVVMRTKEVPTDNDASHYLALVAADGNAGLEIDVELTSRRIHGYSWGSGDADAEILTIVNRGVAGAINVLAATITATRLDLSENGSDATTTILTADDYPVAGDSPLVAVIFAVANSYTALQSITIYDPLPSTTGLSELSETGVTNTAPTFISWEVGGLSDTTISDTVENEIDQTISSTATFASCFADAEGNPLTITVSGDARFSVISNSVHFDATGGLDSIGEPEVSCTVRATDPGGLYAEQEFPITVTA